MKVSRIVGMATEPSISKVLEKRWAVYENSYDVRIPVTANDSPEDLAKKVQMALKSRGTAFVSTRGKATPQSDFHAILHSGLASDGGLYMPDSHIPLFGIAELTSFVHLSYQELAKRILEKFSPTFMPWELDEMINSAYQSFNHADVLPLSSHGDDFYTLDMWHGPTASFKDLSLQLLPKMFQRARDDSTRRGLIVATSGDTGTAALDGFSQDENLPVIVLYPSKGVSPVQELQMQTASPLAKVIGVEKDFDWCQNLVKKYLSDPNPPVVWTSANSINSKFSNSYTLFLLKQLKNSGSLSSANCLCYSSVYISHQTRCADAWRPV